MSTLAIRTKDATDEIAARSSGIVHDVSAASQMVTSHGSLVLEQDELLTASLEHAVGQRQTAMDLATITTETIATVDQAAAAIGRVGANAVAVKVLARQLTRLNKRDQ
jgi:methyl-accepting chemotaxis protein